MRSRKKNRGTNMKKTQKNDFNYKKESFELALILIALGLALVFLR